MLDKNKKAVNDVIENSENYSKHYDENSFFDKILTYGKKAGIKVVFAALLLFYAVKSDKMPLKDKAIVFGALGYFILPIDLIPDFIPVIGYGDDFAVLYATMRMIAGYIDAPVIADAKNKLTDWFTTVDESELDGVLKILS